MVLVASGPHGSGSASGSVGMDTFSHNRFGQYVRARTVPVNPNTARQQAVRAALAELTVRWASTLSAAQRAAWGVYASNVVMKNALGEDTLLTGFNHYLRSGIINKVQSLPHYNDGPTVFELPAKDVTFAFTGSEATQILTLTFNDALDWCSLTGCRFFVFQGIPQNAQRNFFGGPWRYMARLDGNTGAPITSPQDLAVNFAIAEGQRQWLYARILREDGRLSEPFQAQVLIGP